MRITTSELQRHRLKKAQVPTSNFVKGIIVTMDKAFYMHFKVQTLLKQEKDLLD